MGVFERRIGIMDYLSRERQATYDILAAEFGVSKSTIREDVQSLIDAHLPIERVRGRYGGVKLPNNFYFYRNPMTSVQTELLNRLLLQLSGTDAETMQSIIFTYAPQ